MKIHTVSMPQLNRSLGRVQNELWHHDAWNDVVAGIDVYLSPVGWAYGWCYDSSGEIYIPAISALKIRDWWKGEYTSLADVLRHEYAHALAHRYAFLVESRRFENLFDACGDYDEECHVTPYAASKPCEDFAETFMCYLRHRGKIPSQYDTRKLRSKWRFVKEFLKEVAKSD